MAYNQVMCGRYVLRRLDAFRHGITFVQPEFEEFSQTRIFPRYNIAPSQLAPIFLLNHDGQPVIRMMKWGFIPDWTQGKPKLAPINARSETAATSGMFRRAMESQRCLIPADGFYEPKGSKTLKHRPWHFFQLHDAQPMAFGGLWQRWVPAPSAEPVDTFTLLTTAPNTVVGQCHDRMPLILHKRDYQRWLDRDVKAAQVVDHLSSYPADEMESWPVGDGAKRPDNEGPKLIDRKQDRNTLLFPQL